MLGQDFHPYEMATVTRVWESCSDIKSVDSQWTDRGVSLLMRYFEKKNTFCRDPQEDFPAHSFFFFLILFIFGCVGSSLLLRLFLWLQRSGATLGHGAWASH